MGHTAPQEVEARLDETPREGDRATTGPAVIPSRRRARIVAAQSGRVSVQPHKRLSNRVWSGLRGFGFAGLVACSLAAAPSVAHAADCARPYTTAELSRDLSAMTAALRATDEDAYKQTGERLAGQMACVRAALPTRVFASSYRHIGAYYYLAGDFEASKRWFRVAIELEPSFEWDVAELAIDHPLRRAFDAQRATATEQSVRVAGKDLAVPAGSTLMLDGRKITEPEATLDRPHLLMVVGDDRSVRQVVQFEGNAFPDEFLKDAEDNVAVAAAPTRKSKGKQEKVLDPGDEFSTVQVYRVRPPAKTPLMLAGGAVALTGGALYATSAVTRKRFDSATTVADLERYRSLTNTLVVAAGATFAVGLGIEYVGIIIDDQPGVFFRGHF